MTEIPVARSRFIEIISSLVEDPERSSPAALLESQLDHHPASCKTFFAAEPDTVITAHGHQISIVADGETSASSGNPWQALQELRNRRPGWYFGYLGYDLKNHLEDLHSSNRDPVGAPDMMLFRPRLLLIYDHHTEQLSVASGVGNGLNPEGEKEHQTAYESSVLRLLEQERGAAGATMLSADSGTRFNTHINAHTGAGGHKQGDSYSDMVALPGGGAERGRSSGKRGSLLVTGLQSLTGREDYMDRVRQAKQLIREGEIYEVNLSHMLGGQFSGDPFELYRRMRRAGPVPFGSWLTFDDISICSASPERFIRREGSRICSQPIKGTAPRMADEVADSRVRRMLLDSEKDRAENLMIVDLVRHDFSRIALPGSVRVPELFNLQSFNTVHQLVSTVEADVSPGADPVEIIKACFPMGSMTGAPKIRSMEVIEELEDYRRGIYSGAVGYFEPGGQFDFSVVIRTAVIRGGEIFYPVGGAVTSGSDPEKEWEETRVKAHALERALERTA